MTKPLVLGTVLGGLTAFVWSMLSWEVIGWHEKTMVYFQNEEEVSAAISSHAIADGTYMLPSPPQTSGLTPEEKNRAEAAAQTKFTRGPIMVAAVRRGGFGSFSRAIILQVLSLMAAAGLLTWLLLQTRGLGYWRRVAFLGVTGLAASVIVDLPNWNWWGFSGAYTAVNLADFTITWLIAGLVIAKERAPRLDSSAIPYREYSSILRLPKIGYVWPAQSDLGQLNSADLNLLGQHGSPCQTSIKAERWIS